MKFLILILVTAIWGFGFVGTRWTMDFYTPLWSNAWRFVIAGLIGSPYLLFRHKRLNLKVGLVCSLLLFFGMVLQTYGLKYTTLAKSGFLTALYAIFTPLFIWLIYKKKFSPMYGLSLCLSMFGIALMCELKFENVNFGDLLTIASAVFFSVHIIYVEKYANIIDPVDLNFMQCFFMGLLGGISAYLIEGPSDISAVVPWNSNFNSVLFYGFLIQSVLSSLFAFTLQIYAQQDIPAHIVSLIFLLESVFASVFGYLFFGETLTVLAFIGASLLITSIGVLSIRRASL